VHRRGLIGLGALALLFAPAIAGAQEAEVEAREGRPEGVPGDSQEIGATLGFEAGGRTTPGGFVVSGSYLYQLSDLDWFETGIGFTFGGGDAACFRDREDVVRCDHGIASGFAGEISAGLRRYFAGQGAFTPYLRAGLAVRMVAFPDDDLRGVAVPLVAGGGVRARVADHVVVNTSAGLRAGIGVFGRGVDLEPQLSMAIGVGVEFGLD
jgi:hypothetical protein